MWALRILYPITAIIARNLWGHPRPPKPLAGIDGSLDNNLTCQYCKDTGHELDNCKWLQNKLAHECTAMWSIATEESLNTKHHLRRNPLNGEKVKSSQPLPKLDKTEIGPENKVSVKSMQTQFKIMKRAITKCPSVKLKVMGESVASLLDSGSMVSLM